MRRHRLAILLTVGGLLCGPAVLAQPAEAPNQPAPPPAEAPPAEAPKPLVGVDVTAAIVVGHDVASGYKHPRLFFGVIALGPHIGGFYMAGAGILQGVDGSAATFVPIVTYVGQGYIRGWFKKLTLSAGVTQEKILSGKPGWMVCVGIGR